VKDARKFLEVVLLGALIAFVIAAVLTLGTAQRVIEGLPALVHQEVSDARDQAIAAVTGEIRGARADAVDQIAMTRMAAVEQIALTRRAIVVQALDTRLDLDEKIVAGLKLAHIHATEFEDRLDDTNKILLGTALPIAGIAHQINDAAPLFLDCDHNPDCVFNRYVGVSKGVEQSAIAIGKAMPALTANLADTTHHIDRLATSADLFVTKITAPEPWWQRALGITRDLSLLARPFIP
jgi:hypothetical protein